MAFLVDKLPVLAADYSGAISALKQMGVCVILCSPDGCIENYNGMEETAFDSQNMMFCSASIVEREAVLGLEDALHRRAVAFASRNNPPFIALVGSSITALLGTDLQGLARSVEEEAGVSAIAVDTTGYGTYEAGIRMAYDALFQRFASLEILPERKPGLVNILGYTHMDYCNDRDLRSLAALLERNGEAAGCVMGYGGIEELPRLLEAERTLVVSASGLPLARRLESVAGIPYSCQLPIGGDASPSAAAPHVPNTRTLVVGDQVMANGIRVFAEDRYGSTCDVACRQPLDAELAREGDAFTKNEAALAEKVAQGYDLVIADPLCAPVVGEHQLFFGLPRPAFSSLVYQNNSLTLFDAGIVEQLDWIFNLVGTG